MKKLFEDKKKMMLAGLAGIIALSALVFFLFSSPAAKPKREFRAVSIEAEAVRRASLTRRVQAVGLLTPYNIVTVRPQVSGLISEIKVDGGASVSQGDVIMTIDDRQFRAQLKEAEAKHTLAKIEYERADRLVSQKFGAQKVRDNAYANMQAADANADIARKKIEDSTIKAPFEGIITINNISVGSPVNEQTELFTIVDLDPMYLDFRVPAQYLRYLSVGQKIKVKIDGFEDEPFEGEIEAIDAKVDPQAHSITVRAKVPNQNNQLRAGLFARVDLIVGSKDDALVVPLSAVESSGDDAYVYKVIRGRAYRIPVITGLQEGESIEISRGLQEGDMIVVVGQNKIRDGVDVTYPGMVVEADDVEDDEDKSENKESNKKKASKESVKPIKEDKASDKDAKTPANTDTKQPDAAMKQPEPSSEDPEKKTKEEK